MGLGAVLIWSLALAWGAFAQAEDVVKIYGDGTHNAFTDLTCWKGAYYVCFRHGTAHGSLDGEIRIMRSADMAAWEPCATLDTFGDDRDPHFTADDERLYVYFGTWDIVHGKGAALPDRGSVRSHFASTQDGKQWTRAQGVYEPGWWLWRVRRHEGLFYSVAYTAVRPVPSARESRLLRSTDGLNWTLVSTVTRDDMAGEADLWFPPEGGITLLTRTNGDAMLYRSNAAMQEWQGHSTGVPVHSPAHVEWNGRRFIAGRDYHKGNSRTKVWELKQDGLAEIATLPSGGDNAYPGLIVDPRAASENVPVLLLTWYSQHERKAESKNESSIYACRLRVQP